MIIGIAAAGGAIFVAACSDSGPESSSQPIAGAVAFATTDGEIGVASPDGAATAVTGALSFPVAFLFDPQGRYAYVVGPNGVEVRDAATGASRDTLILAAHELRAADLSPDGQYLYVTTSVVDPASGSRLFKIEVPSLTVADSLVIQYSLLNSLVEPTTVAVLPNGGTILLGMNGGLATLAASAEPLAVTDTIEVGAVTEIVFSPDGARAYLVSDEVVGISTSTLAPLDTLERTGIFPQNLVLDPAGNRGYLFMGDTTTTAAVDTMWIDVIELAGGTVVGNVPLSMLMWEPVLPPAGGFLYAFSSGAVHLITAGATPVLDRTLVYEDVDGGVRSAVVP